MIATEILLGITILCAVLFLLGVQIHLVFAVWGIAATQFSPILTLENLVVIFNTELRSFQLAAVPLFIVVGGMLSEFNASGKIIRFIQSFAGWMPGSVGNTAIYMSGVLAAITGSNTSTTAAVGEALHDEMEKDGYDPAFAAATAASGGTLGAIIPPSATLIIYGVYFNVSINQLFLAGVVPGLAMLFTLSAVCSIITYRKGFEPDFSFSAREVLSAGWHAKHAIFTIGILLGGIFAGLFTPTESATAAFFYLATVVVLGTAIGPIRSNRTVSVDVVKEGSRGAGTSIKRIWNPFSLTVTLLGILIPTFLTAIMVQQTLSLIGIVDAIGNAIIGLPTEYLTMLGIIVILLLSGSIMASIPNMVLVAPLLAPAAESLGLSAVMWGIIFMMSDSIGFITPPYGLNLYVISSITGVDYMRVAYAALPYLASLFGVFLFFFVVPEANFLIS